MNLSSEALLNRIVLFTHYLSPDRVELVQDLRDARLGHLPVESLLDLKDSAHSLCWNPVVVLLGSGASLAFSSHRRSICSCSKSGSRFFRLN